MKTTTHRTHILKAAQPQPLGTQNLGAHAGAVAAMSGSRGAAYGTMQGFGPTQTTDEVRQALIEQGMMTGGAFSPGTPIAQFFPAGSPPRQWDLPVGYNVSSRPRANTNRVSFQTLKSIIDAWDVARLCINHHQRDLRSFGWSIQPEEGLEEDVADQIKVARKFWATPDGSTPFDAWQQLLLEDVLRFDAGTLFRERTRAGKFGALQVVSGQTIAPLIDYWGRIPRPPAPSHVQFVQGVPSVWLTRDQVIYRPYQPLPEDMYGLPVVEWLLLTGNTDLRFQWHFLNWFTEGTVPEGFMEAPPDMTDPEVIRRFQAAWDSVMEGDQAQKHKIRWVPSGAKPIFPAEKKFDPQFPLYLLRKVCAGFGITPNDIGITDSVNKASSETQMDVQFRIGTQPLLNYLQGIYTRVCQEDLGLPVRFVFDTGREKEDRLDEARAHQIYIFSGVESPDEVRQSVLGLPIDVENPAPRFVNNNKLGAIPLRSIAEIAGEIDPATAAPIAGSVEQVEAKGLLAPTAPGSTMASAAKPAPPAEETAKPEGEVEATDQGEEGADPGGEDQAGNPTPGEVKKELARWRKNALGRVRRGQPPREFESDLLDGSASAEVWAQLRKARTEEEVAAAFRLPLVKAEARPRVAGLAVVAADTGRVLMIQRANIESDPAAGRWEFPGGHIEDDEDPLAAAGREWSEETGMEVPAGDQVGSWSSPDGIYRGFAWLIPAETAIEVNPDHDRRAVLNPDDPDGDQIEVVAWWDVADIAANPALRPECSSTNWGLLATARLAKATGVAVHQALDRAADHHAPKIAAAIGAAVDARQVAVSGSTKGLGGADLRPILEGIYTDGWELGRARAQELVDKSALRKAVEFDWSTWQPGNPAAAELLANGGFAALQDGRAQTVDGIDDTTRDRIGGILAEGADSGASVDEIAGNIDELLSDPKRAMTIANTELNRAVSASSLDVYAQNDIAGKSWLTTTNACPICQANEDQGTIPLGDSFGSGAQAPPGHTNCRCAVLPQPLIQEGP